MTYIRTKTVLFKEIYDKVLEMIKSGIPIILRVNSADQIVLKKNVKKRGYIAQWIKYNEVQEQRELSYSGLKEILYESDSYMFEEYLPGTSMSNVITIKFGE